MLHGALRSSGENNHGGKQKKENRVLHALQYTRAFVLPVYLMLSQKHRGWLSKNFALQGLVVFQGRRHTSVCRGPEKTP
jgi:hypothetical protein